MLDLIVELALPRTDAGVAAQWAVMVPVWAIVLFLVRRADPGVRQFVLGLVMVNFAWFVVRTLH